MLLVIYECMMVETWIDFEFFLILSVALRKSYKMSEVTGFAGMSIIEKISRQCFSVKLLPRKFFKIGIVSLKYKPINSIQTFSGFFLLTLYLSISFLMNNVIGV